MRELAACISLVSLTLLNFSSAAASEPIDFASDILPLLSDRCSLCHGPDEESRHADLRLDLEQAVDAETQNGGLERVIVPGHSASSELIRRIASDDVSEKMPPPDSNLSLTNAEVELLRRWVDEGAKWEKHWSFRDLSVPVPPPTSGSQSPLDAFVDVKLQTQKIVPAPIADARSLIRRVTLDLTGLPPTPAEVQAFWQDESPGAFDKLVDRLLASPSFGERMAVTWLDAARYADTYGYQSDVYREVWPWRDWVIRAFQENMPYDQFLTHQLAGDLIPDADLNSKLATAFNRLHRQTNEGGSVEEEFRAEYIADRVNTLGTAVLGLTLECARCHDHKYDPISQRDYYQFAAFFTNIDESGLYSHFTNYVPTPTLDLVSEDQQRRLTEAEANVSRLEAELSEFYAKAGFDEAKWLALHAESEVANYSFGDASDSISVENAIKDSAPIKFVGSPSPIAGRNGTGVELDGENGLTTTVGGDWDWYQPFTIALSIKPAQIHDRAVIWHRSKAWTDAASCGYELLLEDGCLSAALIHFWPGDAVRVVAKEPLPIQSWSHVTVSSDGSGKASGLKIYVDGLEVPTRVIRDKLRRTIRGGGANTFDVGHRFRDRGFKGGQFDELRMFSRDLPASTIAVLAKNGIEQLAETVEPTIAQTISHQETLRSELLKARQGIAAIRAEIPSIMTMREEPGLHEARLLIRGQYDRPGEMVMPIVPDWLGPADELTSNTRLDLARWLTRSESGKRHPLVARVVVNRIWQVFFGQGLVATPEDFGMQGQPPTHPLLLDHLASHFIDQDWDVKQLVRHIVTSDAYRRSSAGLTTEDPENRWFSHGPSLRLPIETIRDAALASGNLLACQVGGPPVKPYQPEGLWKEKSGSSYTRDVGKGSHRRSLYTIWKRTSPPPSMTIFDAPGREVCVAGRTTTQTPLQALVLLNDEQFVEAARGVAFRVLAESSNSASERLDRLAEILLARPTSTEENKILLSLLESQDKQLRQSPDSTQQFLTIGDFDYKGAAESLGISIDPVELAAWTVVSQTMMNLKEWVSP